MKTKKPESFDSGFSSREEYRIIEPDLGIYKRTQSNSKL